MGKTYKWDDKLDPRKDTTKAKQDKKVLGRSTKQFWRNNPVKLKGETL